MKILLANMTAYPTIGGVENSLRYTGRELRALGHEVKILCLRMSSDEPERIEHEGIEIIRAPYRPSRWPHVRLNNAVNAAANAIPRVAADFRFDAVWSRSAPVGLGIRRGGYEGPLLQVFPTNAKMQARGIYIQTRGLAWERRLMLAALWPSEYLAASKIERELARKCSMVAFSINMSDQLRASLSDDARPCHVIPPGVDTEAYSPRAGAQVFNQIESEFGLRPDQPIVLYVGRVGMAKGIPMLMDAMLALKTKAKLVLVGDGPDKQRLRAYGDRIGLAGRVVYAGAHHALLPGFYALSRVTVLPSTTESFGQVYLESLSSGTPAIGFKGDGKRILTATGEILKDGETGVVVTAVSAMALGSAIDRIISLSHSEYEEMSQRGRDDVQQRYSWRRFVESALKLSSGNECVSE